MELRKPVNQTAMRKADAEFYRKHPARRGKALTDKPSDAALRTEWFALYQRFGGKVSQSTKEAARNVADASRIVSRVKDPSVRRALKKALSDDGCLTYAEAQQIVGAAMDGGVVTRQEFSDLQTILMNAETTCLRSKWHIARFLAISYARYLIERASRKPFTLPYVKDHIPTTTANSRRPGYAMTPLYLTIHSTGNPNSYATGERKWLTNSTNTRTASFHVVVDEKQAVECIPLSEVAWHAGDGGKGTGNRKSIGLEICESGDREKTLENAISLAAKILRDHGLGASTLRRHRDWRAKNCPRILIDSAHRSKSTQTWEWFTEQVSVLL